VSLLLWTSVSVAAMTPGAFETTLFADQPAMIEAAVAHPTAPVQAVATQDAAEPVIAPPPVVRTLPQTAPSTGPSNGAPGSDIVVTGERRGIAPDPFRSVNETAFKATQAVDDAITAPVARAYKKTLPREVRNGIHNFLYNFREPVVFVNFLLQHKIGKAAETFARFAINTTAGVAVLSVLDHRSEFDDTLKQLHDKTVDPYGNTRTFYLQRRQAEIDALKRGKPLVGGMSEPPKGGVDERGRPLPARPIEGAPVGTPGDEPVTGNANPGSAAGTGVAAPAASPTPSAAGGIGDKVTTPSTPEPVPVG
jgi:hypothetical protein